MWSVWKFVFLLGLEFSSMFFFFYSYFIWVLVLGVCLWLWVRHACVKECVLCVLIRSMYRWFLVVLSGFKVRLVWPLLFLLHFQKRRLICIFRVMSGKSGVKLHSLTRSPLRSLPPPPRSRLPRQAFCSSLIVMRWRGNDAFWHLAHMSQALWNRPHHHQSDQLSHKSQPIRSLALQTQPTPQRPPT